MDESTIWSVVIGGRSAGSIVWTRIEFYFVPSTVAVGVKLCATPLPELPENRSKPLTSRGAHASRPPSESKQTVADGEGAMESPSLGPVGGPSCPFQQPVTANRSAINASGHLTLLAMLVIGSYSPLWWATPRCPSVIRRAWSTIDRARVQSQLVSGARGPVCLLPVPWWLRSGWIAPAGARRNPPPQGRAGPCRPWTPC